MKNLSAIRKIDLHMHSTVSDGTYTPEEILELVRNAGIDLFSLTDHDAVKGCRIIREKLAPGDPLFITGAEFSCKDNGGKYHILGYGYDPDAGAVNELMESGHSNRLKKLKFRIDALKGKFGFGFSEEDIDSLFHLDNPGKPHLANLMVKYGYAKNKESAFSEFLNKLKIPAMNLAPEKAIEAILKSGGIPVLAHPSYGSGDELYTGKEMEDRVTRLVDMGLQGLEAYYSGFTCVLGREILGYAEKYGLYVTAGSDYHGENKMAILGDTHLEDAQDGPEGLRRFLEAAVKQDQ
ncbi:MAG: PHP domain-containing protein [Anaerolineaceae bacterium]|nr:PHP domain-containing protein [Anaerolineaceae bacterium]